MSVLETQDGLATTDYHRQKLPFSASRMMALSKFFARASSLRHCVSGYAH